jgi:ATP-dependent Clp protease ATP-binding subunit ClpA
LTDAVRRARAGIKIPEPAGGILSCFWVRRAWAKRSWRKALAEFLCSMTRTLIVRIDMSEYMEKHTVARLIGAPPGYVGYEEGGQLSEAVRRKSLQRGLVR